MWIINLSREMIKAEHHITLTQLKLQMVKERFQCQMMCMNC